MQKIQVFLRQDQKDALKALAARTGARQSDLVRQSVDLLLQTTTEQDEDWREATRGVAGLWKDRAPFDAEEARQALKKRFSGIYRRR
jgi:Arc/MetJ-type ribon-helix-helix transcriptional regulator